MMMNILSNLYSLIFLSTLKHHLLANIKIADSHQCSNDIQVSLADNQRLYNYRELINFVVITTHGESFKIRLNIMLGSDIKGVFPSKTLCRREDAVKMALLSLFPWGVFLKTISLEKLISENIFSKQKATGGFQRSFLRTKELWIKRRFE